MSKSASVQQLLQAEKRAAEIVDSAKKNRVQKLKQAKLDAEAEVTKFRQKRQAVFETFQKEQNSSGTEGGLEVVKQAKADIERLQRVAAERQDRVADLLVSLVTKVHVGDIPKKGGVHTQKTAAPAADDGFPF
eukprot:NODE_8505_length_698_cov_78.744348_g8249_i0.p1 GENE.NODE_8505_length_698_cov_78.744348_g8249_i0~~NODE_8505_length_698_cov_78.744348_g8249_i0.p1  ORF type:complete len:133 (-),score=45.41 NODE_8505_length_698_cov_78.744348_g8249_i0:241-639(-)